MAMPPGGKSSTSVRERTCTVHEYCLCRMVKNCCVGCKNYVGKKEGQEGLRLFRFPLADKERCTKWTAAVRRQVWQPNKSTRICNDNFISGRLVSDGFMSPSRCLWFQCYMHI